MLKFAKTVSTKRASINRRESKLTNMVDDEWKGVIRDSLNY